MKNSFIDLLAAYGPVADGDAMYDEHVGRVAARTGHDPIEIPETISKKVVDLLRGTPARSVILTGTAGDGKTYTARKAFKALSSALSWTDDEEQTITVEGRKITFIKDLSELDLVKKAALAPRLLDGLLGSAGGEVFVVCANDGHLLRSWSGSSDLRARELVEILSVMLRDDLVEPAGGHPFCLINMSRRSRAEALDDIVEAMLSHPSWSACDPLCPGLADATPCPIRLNRALLLEDGEASFRTRLKSLIEIAAADDDHLSLRHVMILVVNTLLGDNKVPQTPLLDCKRARIRASNGEYRYTNPFANVFGENHPSSVQEQVAAFSVLRRYGVGEETNNRVDDALLDPEPLEELPDHSFYGTPLIAAVRDRYIEDPSRYIGDLRPLLRDQRRRLFFTLPDDGKRPDGPWALTLLNSGSLYMRLLHEPNPTASPALQDVRRVIIRGFNRTLTGSMTETSGALWLTQPSGVFLGQEVPLLYIDPMGWTGYGPRVRIVAPQQPGRPPMLAVFLPGHAASLEALSLTPALFEYLARVADGALPTSFSNECLQEIRGFQIRVAGAFESMSHEDDHAPTVSIVETADEELHKLPVGLLINPVAP